MVVSEVVSNQLSNSKKKNNSHSTFSVSFGKKMLTRNLYNQLLSREDQDVILKYLCVRKYVNLNILTTMQYTLVIHCIENEYDEYRIP